MHLGVAIQVQNVDVIMLLFTTTNSDQYNLYACVSCVHIIIK